MRSKIDLWLTKKLQDKPMARALYWSLMYRLSKPVEFLAKKLGY